MENRVFEGATLLFDLDGTLIDTAPDLLKALNAVLANNGYPPVLDADIRKIVGKGARAMLMMALEKHGVSVSSHDLDEMFDQFIAFYEDNVFVDSEIFDDVETYLATYKAAGAKLVVCTNKLQRLSDQVLTQSGLWKYFDDLYGADRVSAKKPDPAHLLEAIEAVGGDRGRTIMIGDSATDFNAAKAGNIPCLLFELGYTDIPVQSMGSDGTFDHYEQLTPMLEKLLSL